MKHARYLPFVAASLALVSACGETSRCKAGACGTAVIVTTGEPDAVFPPIVQSLVGAAISDQVFLKLADMGLGLNTVGDSGFVPRLARSWKFEDSLTIAFELDPRAKWQDGKPVTAADVAFTFDVYRDPQLASPGRPLLDRIASVTARDERTAVIHFRRRYAEQFYDATHHMRILPRHLLDSIPRSRLASHAYARHPVGDGPYRFVDWKAGASIELAADNSYFEGKPGIARLVWTVTPDFNTAITQLVAGEADMMEYIGGAENVARVGASPQMRVESYPSATYVYLGFNLWDPKNSRKPHPLFGDRNLRRALQQGLDRPALLRAVLGDYGSVPVGPVSRVVALGNDTTIPRAAFDPAAASAALDKMGWRVAEVGGIRRRNGRPLEFEILLPSSSQMRRRAAVVIQDQLKQIGVSVKITEVDFKLFQEITAERRFNSALLAWGESPSPSGIQQTFTTAGIGKSNYQGYGNPRFDRLVTDAVNAADPKVARTKWREAYSLINDDVPGIWLFAPIQPAAIHKRYENVTIRPDQWTATLWKWRVASGQQIGRDQIGAKESK